MKLSAAILIAVSLLVTTNAYSPLGVTTRRSTMTMKKGRSFRKEINGGGESSSSSSAGMGPSRNWINTNQKVDMLPKEDASIALLDTGAFLLVNKGTNPTGAVCVMKYGPEIYCFSSACPRCKIPMTKAKALPPSAETGKSPRISCDFCKATFNIKTGEKVESEEKTGFLGGIARAVLSTQENGPLPIYELGEKNGKILFCMD